MKDLARRLDCIQPFHVMDILARARALEAAGRLVIHMEIGEPDFPTVESIVAAGIDALEAGKTHCPNCARLLPLATRPSQSIRIACLLRPAPPVR